MRDFRTVIEGRIGWNGHLYSNSALARFEGQEVAVIGVNAHDWQGKAVSACVHDADGKKIFLVLEVQP